MKIHRTLSLCAALLTLLLVFRQVPPLPAKAAASGTAGSLSWTLDESGTLTLSGKGDMPDYGNLTDAPWDDLRSQIRSVVAESGVTGIGEAAFYQCPNLTRATLASSVTQIGDYAFAECESLLSVQITGVTAIGRDAFRYCVSLTALTLPEGLTSLGTEAFYRCESLLAVTVPASVTYMGSSVFAYCISLAQATVNADLDTLPAWSFYGCSALTGVAFGDSISAAGDSAFTGCTSISKLICSADAQEELLAALQEGSPSLSEDEISNSGTLTTTYSEVQEGQTEEGTLLSATTVTSQSGSVVSDWTEYLLQVDATIRITAQVRTISITILNSQGLEEAETYLEVVAGESSAVLSGIASAESAAPDAVELILLSGITELPGSLLQAAASTGAVLTVYLDNGVVWSASSNALTTVELSDSYDLGVSYFAVESLSPRWEAVLGEVSAFSVAFSEDVNFNCAVTLPLSCDSGSVISLFADKEQAPIQSVYADRSGSATFYLANVASGREYMAGVNVVGITDVIVSGEDAQSNYGGELVNYDVYAVTGVSSSWGIELWQMTIIIAAVLVVSLGAVGIVMFSLNRRKLKQGYVPDIPPEDPGIPES